MEANTITIIISLVAIGIAVWQGILAKQQLDESKRTQSETEKLLDEIKDIVKQVDNTSNEVRRNVQEQINKLIEQQDQNFKTLLTAPQSEKQNDMIMQLFPLLIQNPDLLEKISKFGNKNKSE